MFFILNGKTIHQCYINVFLTTVYKYLDGFLWNWLMKSSICIKITVAQFKSTCHGFPIFKMFSKFYCFPSKPTLTNTTFWKLRLFHHYSFLKTDSKICATVDVNVNLFLTYLTNLGYLLLYLNSNSQHVAKLCRC